MPLTVIATLKAKKGKEDVLYTTLKGLLAPTRAEQGCIIYDMHKSADEPGLFMFTEEWETRPLWDDHMNAPHLKAFAARQDDLCESWTLFTGEKV
ncbi:MAG: antibiotic biosynthesis monooxygenase [Rhodobacter sp.]|nr:antibiotic biosynthesis monooxygenase [Rhodobacter sp.]